MQQYNFDRLIKRYSSSFGVLIPGEGHYEAGDWITGEPSIVQMTGAVLPLGARRIYESGGVLSSLDRQLILQAGVDGDLNQVKIRYKGTEYTPEEDTDYSDFSGVHAYILKAVSR